jgi:hypothetical protein
MMERKLEESEEREGLREGASILHMIKHKIGLNMHIPPYASVLECSTYGQLKRLSIRCI